MTAVHPWREAPAATFAVIGDPIAHSLSPAMHAAAFRALGIEATYVAVHVPEGEVAAALDHLRDLGVVGVNVTVPHKAAALAWCAHREPFAERAQAANTLRLADRSGLNTDGPGFLRTLDGREVRQALLLGAGGSARALALALAEAGVALRIHNRTSERAAALAEAVGGTAVSVPDPEGADLLLNATSASLAGEGLALDWQRARPDALAYDLAYGHGATPFLAAAAAAGLAGQDGRALLVEQGALAFEWWHGRPAPRAAMREAVGC